MKNEEETACNSSNYFSFKAFVLRAKESERFDMTELDLSNPAEADAIFAKACSTGGERLPPDRRFLADVYTFMRGHSRKPELKLGLSESEFELWEEYVSDHKRGTLGEVAELE